MCNKAVSTLVCQADLVFGLPAQQAALETTVSFVTLFAAFYVFGKLRHNSCLDDLVLTAALAVIALSKVLFVMLPMLAGSATGNPDVLAAIIGRSAGDLLFTAAAFVPRVRLRRSGRTLGLATAGVLGILVVAAVLPRVFGTGLPPFVAHTQDGLHATPGLAVAEIVTASLTSAAALGYVRRFKRFGDEFSGWLATAAIFATASNVNFVLFLTIHSARVSLGGIFRLCFFVVLLIGALSEIQSYRRKRVTAIVEKERRRIACDLHDGLSQELAYLSRNLASLQGAADEKTLRRLQVCAERARLATRQAVRPVATPVQSAVAEALATAAVEVAERLGLDLKLDLDAGIGMTPERGDALVRIACEALTNAARHSGSRQVSLMLRREGGRVRMRVRDSGHGFDPDAFGDGFGLTSMRDRARLVGGELRISSELGAGSQVEAML